MSKADEVSLKQTKCIEKQDLIINDFGMQPLDDMTRMILFEIVEDRHQEYWTFPNRLHNYC